MKKVLLTSMLVLMVIFAFALTRADIKATISMPENAKPLNDFAKDSAAAAAGGVVIMNLGGDMRGFAPPSLSSMAVMGDTVQITTGLYDAVAGGFVGVYYVLSTDAGTTWSVPVRISDAGPYLRNYHEIITPSNAYPYVIINQRTGTPMLGDWFTLDMAGPGGGNWMSPILVTDTVNYYAYMPSLAVSPAGDKVAMLAFDAAGGFGVNTSVDYGFTWGTYGWDANLNDSTILNGVDASKIVWGNGDTVFAILSMNYVGIANYWDIAGYSSANSTGFAISTDGGATYEAIMMPYGQELPNYQGMDGDTFIYYIDTLDNGTVDQEPVKAYYDTATGYWADEIGNVDASAYGFGSWWYWWDAEYINGKVYYSIPMAQLVVDYYDSGTKLYTFPWQPNNLVFGWYENGTFTNYYYQLHDDSIIDTTGATATWRGNAFSMNITYDSRNDVVYLVYIDYPTTTGYSSVELVKFDPNSSPMMSRLIDPLIPNAGAYVVEAAKTIDPNGILHIAIVPGSQDSIYYWNFDVDNYSDPTLWEPLSVRDNKIVSSEFIFNAPSLIRGKGEISFALSNNSNVKISLFDITGREVMTLANKEFSAGNHTISLNTNELTQGVYFANIKTDTNSDSKKIIIVK